MIKEAVSPDWKLRIVDIRPKHCSEVNQYDLHIRADCLRLL